MSTNDSTLFDKFWQTYPRRVAKQDARRAWIKLKVDDALLALILRALQGQVIGWSDIQYVPYPATWLNGRRWEDAPPAALPKPTAPVSSLATSDGIAYPYACNQCYDSGAVRSAGVWIRCACHSGTVLDQGALDAANGRVREGWNA